MEMVPVNNSKDKIKNPELVVLFKSLIWGLLASEIFATSFILGTLAYSVNGYFESILQLALTASAAAWCVYYCYLRNLHSDIIKLFKSSRFDVYIFFVLGVLIYIEIWRFVEGIHHDYLSLIKEWVPEIFSILILIMFSPVLRYWQSKKSKVKQKQFFLSDSEISESSADLFDLEEQVSDFAKAVTQSAEVFGVDGQWGVGKTSFINLAEKIWQTDNKLIVCRFEPLRYASESDLAERLIRELTSAVKENIFAPEFPIAANRYSTFLKGKAEVSFWGIKFSLEPSTDSIDDLLDDLDNVLQSINRKVIVVIDDLDRLDPKTVNNILFATKRTLRLRQVTYVLCYDTEVLIGNGESSSNVREFLEKFVTIKYALFADASHVRKYLRGSWKEDVLLDDSTTVDALIRLSRICESLAEMLDGQDSAKYLSLVGNLRKVKRFINAIRLMQIERLPIERTDFNYEDLIHLILLYLNYPGIFRRIYAEEAGGNTGMFSLKKDTGDYSNSESLENFRKTINENAPAKFLIDKLFYINEIKWAGYSGPNEDDIASRACFNSQDNRNLEAYLKFIVRVVTPKPQSTLRLYKEAISQIKNGEPIESIITSTPFSGSDWEATHDRFWIEFLRSSVNLPKKTIEESITTLVKFLPQYPLIALDESRYRALREVSVYMLLQILNRAGFGESPDQNESNTGLSIANRIFGEKEYKGIGLITSFIDESRGPLGWFDLLLFRLTCSADRQGQLYAVMSALLKRGDVNAETSGDIRILAISEMREISQAVFKEFKEAYIIPGRNFLAEMDTVSEDQFLGTFVKENASNIPPEVTNTGTMMSGARAQIEKKRTAIKSFVLYQLSNKQSSGASGIGCGYYDEMGVKDERGIAELMNDYIFNICFNPDIDEENAVHFFDHCLRNLSINDSYSGSKHKFSASLGYLFKELDLEKVKVFWRNYSAEIRTTVRKNSERVVYTSNYTITYSEVSDIVLATLDKMLIDSAEQEEEKR